MNYKKLAAFAAVLTMMTSAVSCGSDANGDSSADTTAAVTVDGTAETEDNPTTGTGTATTSKNSSKTTAKTTDSKSTKTTSTAANSAGTTVAGAKSTGSASGGSAETTKAASGGSSSQETSSAEEEVKEYTAEIKLGSSPDVTGENVTVDGSTVTINAGGDYIFTGSVDNGQIIVDTGASEEKVTVVLNGVDISNDSLPAIYIREAKKCTIKPKEGSVNYVSSDIPKKGVSETGAIFSNDTIRLKGNGKLYVTATASHGISSDDDVIIESGTYIIDSRKSGIIANDDVTINSGDVTIFGGTNGIKAKGGTDAAGSININGGTMHISGGTKEEKHSIYASVFNYTGGTVFAAGNKFTEPLHSAAPYVGFGFKNGGAADSELTFYVNGKEVGTLTPHKEFKSAVMFFPDLSVGDKVSISVDGKSEGEFKVEDTKTEIMIG